MYWCTRLKPRVEGVVVQELGDIALKENQFQQALDGTTNLTDIHYQIVSLGLTIKTYWYKIKGLVSGNKAVDNSELETPEEER